MKKPCLDLLHPANRSCLDGKILHLPTFLRSYPPPQPTHLYTPISTHRPTYQPTHLPTYTDRPSMMRPAITNFQPNFNRPTHLSQQILTQKSSRQEAGSELLCRRLRSSWGRELSKYFSAVSIAFLDGSWLCLQWCLKAFKREVYKVLWGTL